MGVAINQILGKHYRGSSRYLNSSETSRPDGDAPQITDHEAAGWVVKCKEDDNNCECWLNLLEHLFELAYPHHSVPSPKSVTLADYRYKQKVKHQLFTDLSVPVFDDLFPAAYVALE